MVVVVYGRGDSGVVVGPLFTVNFTVTVFVTEVSEELEEDLVLSHLSGDNLRVHVGGVDSLEVGSLDGTVTVVVELEEGLVNHSLSLLVESSTDTDEELIEVDGTGLVGIEELHEALALSLGDVATDVLESGEEFVGIALSVTIHGVEVSEGSTKTSDSLGTSGSELGAQIGRAHV